MRRQRKFFHVILKVLTVQIYKITFLIPGPKLTGYTGISSFDFNIYNFFLDGCDVMRFYSIIGLKREEAACMLNSGPL